jgi:hypothetical protein
VPEERLQNRIAFAFVQLNDPCSEDSIDEQGRLIGVPVSWPDADVTLDYVFGMDK